MANMVTWRDVLCTVLVAERIFHNSQFFDKIWGRATSDAERLE